MQENNKIYIFGHKKPDTDSITASIALANLKKELGLNVEARALGNPNNETKFVLDYFKVDAPKYLNDVKIKVRDLDFIKNYSAKLKDSMFKGFQAMSEKSIDTLPIVDEEKKLLGLVSLKDIAKYQFSDEITNLCTSYNNILEALNAREILKIDDEITGNIIIASYKSTTFIETVKLDSDTILIVGDRYSILEHAIAKKVKLIITTGNRDLEPELLEKAKENKVNIISSKNNTFITSRKIGMANYLEKVLINEGVITIEYANDVNDFVALTKKYKYSNYPVVKDGNKYIGLIRVSDITSSTKKKAILVDHSEILQSVDGIEDAEIIEIVDHHNIGTITTEKPIIYRNMPVGSSNTIINILYKENNIQIPKQIAGLMLSGIISDTLLFNSPTTTELDRQTGIELAAIAGVNIEEYGMSMLKAGSSLKGKTIREILYTDFKSYTVNGKKFGIGQITTFNINEIMDEKEKYIELINEIATNDGYYIIGLFATDIIKNGSYMFYNDSAEDVLDNCFGLDKIYQGYYLDGVVSRKKQIIPNIMDEIEKK